MIVSDLSTVRRRKLLAIHPSNPAVVNSAFALGRPLLIHLKAVFDRPQLQVILKPKLGGEIVFDTFLLAEGLGDEERAVISDAEGDGVLDKRVLREDGPGERRDGGDGK